MGALSSETDGRQQHAPGLFDLAQDIIGGLPIRLLAQWAASERTEADALRLLAGCRVTGYSVVSDSDGLTRMSAERGLMDILAIISEPKSIVHRVGVGLGGEAVGIWAADNTQMLYPAELSADTLVASLLTVRDEVSRGCAIQIGLGAHFGGFYRATGGLYGDEAEAIEAVTEDHARGGEVFISQAVVRRLSAFSSNRRGRGFILAVKEAPATAMGALYEVVDGPRLSDLPGHVLARPDPGLRYPIPYSDAFYTDLLQFSEHPCDPALAQQMTDKYVRERTVVVIERHGEEAGARAVLLLNNLLLSVMMQEVGLRHLEGGHEVKVSGPLGIYVFDGDRGGVRRALAFAEAFRRGLDAEGVKCRIGVDVGPVLVFDLAGGGRDIAGMPVNIASKMAQDRGAWGKIYLSDRVQAAVAAPGFRALRQVVSGIELQVFEG